MALQNFKIDASGNALVSAQLATFPQLVQGTAASAQPHGTLRVTPDPTSIFYDAFSGGVLDVTNRWGTSGTAPVQTNGILTFPASTASTTSVLTSLPVIPLTASQFVFFASVVKLEAAVGTGVGRFYGLGTAPTTPTPTSLAQEGVGFEVDSATGVLQAVTYTGGVKTVIAPLVKPTDNGWHRYSMQYRNSRTYWFVDDINVYVATGTFLNTAVQDLFVLGVSVSGAAPVNTPALAFNAIGVSDLNRQATQISDGLFAWRKATVKAASVPAVATDGALVVGLHPSSPLPAGVNTLGTVLPYRPNTANPTSVPSSVTSVTLLAANTNRAGATITNNSTAVLYVEIGATASLSAYTVPLSPLVNGIGGYWEVPFGYRGVISGIWASANGNALCRELV